MLQLTEDTYFSEESDIVITRNFRYTYVDEHEHTFFEIMYLMTGEGKNVVDGSEITMRSGDFCIIPPRVSHSICVESDSVLLNILVRTSMEMSRSWILFCRCMGSRSSRKSTTVRL